MENKVNNSGWKKKNRVKKEKGYGKEYLNNLRRVGCTKPRCGLCHSWPVNKSLEKTKGQKKINNRNMRRRFTECDF